MTPLVSGLEAAAEELPPRVARWRQRFRMVQLAVSGLALALLVWEIGWPLSERAAQAAEWLTWILILLALVSETGLDWQPRGRKLARRVLALALLLTLALGRFGLERPIRDWLGGYFPPRSAALAALVLIQLTLVFPILISGFKLLRSRFFQFSRPGSLFVSSFLLVILAGTLLLKTPNATTGGISWIDAFFTSTSAVCVTGLSVVNTETAFTFHGQAIILGLIQTGALGLITYTYFLALVMGQGITLRDRTKLSDLLSEVNLGSVGGFARTIVLVTLLMEAIGAALLWWSWKDAPPRGEGRLLWDAAFHSISAFCNAGFSTFGDGLADAKTVGNRGCQLTIMALIVAGGLGFAVVQDLPRHLLAWLARVGSRIRPGSRRLARCHVSRPVRIQTWLSLRMTILLLVGGCAALLLAEGWLPTVDRLWEAAFNSVTARTAGFNITDFGSYGSGTVIVMCFLMFVGGNPGGTAGGVKTIPFAVSLGELGRIVRGHADLNIRNRRIDRDVVDRCTATVVLSMLWLAVCTFVVTLADPDLRFEDIVFECFSAFGTVGLTRGITFHLSDISKLTLAACMFVGRVGLLTFVFTLAGRSTPRRFQYPDARLPLG